MVELKEAYDLTSRSWCYPRDVRQLRGCFRGTINDAYRICADIASALDYLASNGTIHNDIKAANILYTPEGGATLIDFGLGQSVNEGFVRIGGSPWYMDPEIVTNSTKRTLPCDMFSFGVVMLYVLREVPVPEREPEWNIHDREEEAYRMRVAWYHKVQERRDALGKSPSGTAKEMKLRRLVQEMLKDNGAERISARDLARQTRTWTSFYTRSHTDAR